MTYCNKGFTLVEVIIYSGIIGIFMLGFVSYTLVIFAISNKAYAVGEVQANTRLVFDVLKDDIHNCRTVVTPERGGSSDELEIELPGGENIQFSLQEGVLYRGTVALTTDEVEIENLEFINAAYEGNIENVSINLKLKYREAGSVGYGATETLSTTISSSYLSN